MTLLPTMNPYGETKVISERILTDVVQANPDLGVSLLRYFNPVGAHESGLIGEAPNGIPNNLMPYVTQVAKGKLAQLYLFRNYYPTVDGIGVRNYIYVVDLAEGHVAVLEQLKAGVHVYNLGTGRGMSVLELVKHLKKRMTFKCRTRLSIVARVYSVLLCGCDESEKRVRLWRSEILSRCAEILGNLKKSMYINGSKMALKKIESI